MAKSGAYIIDIHLLERLDEQIGSSGEAMASIDQNVCDHLNTVRDTLERQLDTIREKLQEAEQKLSEAENALSSCKANQVLEPETGTFVPSCDCEENAVESARTEVEKWRTKYERGQQILEECQREIGEYNGPGGGHSLIQTMSKDQTPKVSQLLRDYIEKLQDILNSDMVVSTNVVSDTIPKEQSTSLSGEGYVNDLKNFFNL
jgi:flagellar biosynthesis chaperone FliJ